MTKPKAAKRAHTGVAGKVIEGAARVISEATIEAAAHPDGSPFDRLMRAADMDDATLGATTRALLPLLAVGLMGLEKDLADIRSKRPRGRPAKPDLADLDCCRAYTCWAIVRRLGGASLSNQKAIERMQEIEEAIGIPLTEQIFPRTTDNASLEQSLSRGKTKLGFTGKWTCSTCERIYDAP